MDTEVKCKCYRTYTCMYAFMYCMYGGMYGVVQILTSKTVSYTFWSHAICLIITSAVLWDHLIFNTFKNVMNLFITRQAIQSSANT